MFKFDRSTIPKNPGVYIFKDRLNNIIYIGKAKNLKNRVSSYFSSNNHSIKTKFLVKNINDIDYIIVDNEVESLLLENKLIKKHKPKYNINLKDSKRYAFIQITNEEYLRLLVARKRDGKGKLFGPFVSGMSRDYVLEDLKKIL